MQAATRVRRTRTGACAHHTTHHSSAQAARPWRQRARVAGCRNSSVSRAGRACSSSRISASACAALAALSATAKVSKKPGSNTAHWSPTVGSWPPPVSQTQPAACCAGFDKRVTAALATPRTRTKPGRQAVCGGRPRAPRPFAPPTNHPKRISPAPSPTAQSPVATKRPRRWWPSAVLSWRGHTPAKRSSPNKPPSARSPTARISHPTSPPALQLRSWARHGGRRGSGLDPWRPPPAMSQRSRRAPTAKMSVSKPVA